MAMTLTMLTSRPLLSSSPALCFSHFSSSSSASSTVKPFTLPLPSKPHVFVPSASTSSSPAESAGSHVSLFKAFGIQEGNTCRIKLDSLVPIGTTIKLCFALLVGATVLTLTTVEGGSAYAMSGKSPMVLFQHSCVGCHAGGGNILQPGATLTSKDLLRNGLSTVEDIYRITYSGKGRMPGFGEKCTPRGQCTFGPRLSDEDIRALAEFVRLQADQGW